MEEPAICRQARQSDGLAFNSHNGCSKIVRHFIPYVFIKLLFRTI